jgi:hypothetical protein
MYVLQPCEPCEMTIAFSIPLKAITPPSGMHIWHWFSFT